MKTHTLPLNPAFLRQRGAATLLVVMMLLIGMALLTLTTSRTGIMEQKITGNDIRAKDVQEAAEAGLEYGIAWAKDPENSIDADINCPGGANCPTLPTITNSTSGEVYSISALSFVKGTDYIKVTATAQGTDTSITATSESFIKQLAKPLFKGDAVSPPPWVTAGCITTAATGTPSTFLLDSTAPAVISGSSSDAGCLPQGHLNVSTWTDDNGNGVLDNGENGSSAPFNTGTFSGCPATNCAWKQYFQVSLADAKHSAIDAGHGYSGNIPCGAADSAPSIYVINNGGPINSGDISGSCSGVGVDGTTIGAPGKPILLIVPSSAGCPKFNGGVTIYGIVYYESTTACASQGWGGATIYGAVIWEGDVDKPNANSKFIHVNYGGSGADLDISFGTGVDDATRIPGTWKDF